MPVLIRNGRHVNLLYRTHHHDSRRQGYGLWNFTLAKSSEEKKFSDNRTDLSTSDHSLMDRLFLDSLLGSLGNLTGTGSGLLNGLDDTDSDGLTHVTDSETTEGRVLSESLNTHGLGGNHLDDSSITRLDELGVVLHSLTGTAVDLLQELRELASNVSGVAVEDGSVTSTDLSRVVQDDNLSIERSGTHGGVVLGVTADVTTTDLLNGNVLDVKTDVVTGDTLDKLLVVHLNGLDLSGDTSGGEGDDHTGLDDTGLDTTDGHCADTTDLVDILEGKTEGLVGRTDGGLDGVDSLEEGLTLGDTGLGLLSPSLVPGHVGGGLDHVVSVPSGDGDESNGLGVVTDLLDEVGGLLDDLLETGLGPLGGVHLVDGNDELLDTEGVGQESVLTGLTVLGDTSLELTSTTGDDENGTVSLGGTSDHVLDEITVTRGVNDGDVELGGLELPESNVDGDTTLTLSLKFVQNPGVLEGTLTELSSLLLELLNGTLVDTTALVDQVTGGGGLSRVDVSNDNDVNVSPEGIESVTESTNNSKASLTFPFPF
ncbi:hypothetical protein G7K_2513-t1 [Saitoella complicata NRRL Y-17804]|uniref:Uncharacterized protein n=1 Tax=Saitoella complicata (strain BCRC 22490 / CBS 7301 / JCM 7358 / NBRC 10748 / NRRL Y-17804) TaxID=698492 RepID=A0A0E9NER5_SAICN|nr:hypothetical protein G7K_2513-t1 [Saitoella complicata NRRL Y-17804]